MSSSASLANFFRGAFAVLALLGEAVAPSDSKNSCGSIRVVRGALVTESDVFLQSFSARGRALVEQEATFHRLPDEQESQEELAPVPTPAPVLRYAEASGSRPHAATIGVSFTTASAASEKVAIAEAFPDEQSSEGAGPVPTPAPAPPHAATRTEALHATAARTIRSKRSVVSAEANAATAPAMRAVAKAPVWRDWAPSFALLTSSGGMAFAALRRHAEVAGDRIVTSLDAVEDSMYFAGFFFLVVFFAAAAVVVAIGPLLNQSLIGMANQGHLRRGDGRGRRTAGSRIHSLVLLMQQCCVSSRSGAGGQGDDELEERHLRREKRKATLRANMQPMSAAKAAAHLRVLMNPSNTGTSGISEECSEVDMSAAPSASSEAADDKRGHVHLQFPAAAGAVPSARLQPLPPQASLQGRPQPSALQ